MKQQNLIIGAIVGVLLIIGIVVFFNNRGSQKTEETNTEEEAIPPVDASVKVDLTGTNSNRDVTISVKGIPKGTQTIDYELSYDTKAQGLQGVIGTITLDNETEAEKKITLGTCSSGTCVYHEVSGKIKVSLKFTGDYGERIFEKEYAL